MIGGKWPTIDIYAELISPLPQKMFCFFQMKATDQGYTKRLNNLKVSVDLEDLLKLSQYCAPTYVIGIDHNAAYPFKSKAFLGAIRGMHTKRLSSLITNYPLTDSNLIALSSEITAYWSGLKPLNTKATYLTKFAI